MAIPTTAELLKILSHLDEGAEVNNKSIEALYNTYERGYSSNERLRQNEVFLHTSRLALGNLRKTINVRVCGFSFVNKEWGIFELESTTGKNSPYEGFGQKTV
ncbi:hypothetical protein H735_04445 [Vibrio owensii CAIM 1854 = LMG 25443]|uniref:Uncharacterized protein n=1 Tax=Vibrio owensii CAIM 1854 = LMG 25443 TaxID=1229493 RepID=A0A0C1ZMM5_9VIBR|nr:hypothetical protein H735_04445 [Vibrio owensii CAIM 1854 = LMG 25443]